MRKNIYLPFLLIWISCQETQPKVENANASRVKQAELHKKNYLLKRLEDVRSEQGAPVYVIAYKAEKELEVWIENTYNHKYVLFDTYAICAASGTLGRKLEQGDYQVPEGFYKVNRFNPESNFHLSLGIDYPNAADRKVVNAERPGGDIYIHGSCASVGCLAMTDDGIEEIYLLCDWARQKGRDVVLVHIYPFRFDEGNWLSYCKQYPSNVDFWKQLKEGHEFFVLNGVPLDPIIDPMGNYRMWD